MREGNRSLHRVRDWGAATEGAISLRARVDAVDEADRCVHMTLRAETADGQTEQYPLTVRQWYRDELEPLLREAGFAEVDVIAGVDENTVVYVAKRE